MKCLIQFLNFRMVSFTEGKKNSSKKHIFTHDSCTGRYCWEHVLAMGILSVRPSVRHDPVVYQALAFRGYQHWWHWTTLNPKNMGFKWIFRCWR